MIAKSRKCKKNILTKYMVFSQKVEKVIFGNPFRLLLVFSIIIFLYYQYPYRVFDVMGWILALFLFIYWVIKMLIQAWFEHNNIDI